MKCKICGCKDMQFIAKWSDSENEYGCLGCGRTTVTRPENEDKDKKV